MNHMSQESNFFLFLFSCPGILQLLSGTGSIFLASGGCEEHHSFWQAPHQAFPVSSPIVHILAPLYARFFSLILLS